jgi:hypothetical protein
MSNDQTSLDRALDYAGKMGGINFEAKRSLEDLKHLKTWIGNGNSRKTLAMRSLVANLEARLGRIAGDSK